MTCTLNSPSRLLSVLMRVRQASVKLSRLNTSADGGFGVVRILTGVWAPTARARTSRSKVAQVFIVASANGAEFKASGRHLTTSGGVVPGPQSGAGPVRQAAPRA